MFELKNARRQALCLTAQAVDGIPEPRCRPADMAGQIEFDLLGEEIMQEAWLEAERYENLPPGRLACEAQLSVHLYRRVSIAVQAHSTVMKSNHP